MDAFRVENRVKLKFAQRLQLKSGRQMVGNIFSRVMNIHVVERLVFERLLF